MNKFFTALLVVTTLLALTGSPLGSAYLFADHASAQGPVGADCTDPPNLVPFADLTNCDLSGMDMAGINLYDADLAGANLSDANLSGADLTGADLIGANLSGANLDNAELFTTDLIAANFDNASLRNTNMEDAYAPGGSFVNADLRGANIYFATMSDANLSGANLSDSWLSIHTFEGSILQNANFSGSTISGDMRNTDLRGADLSFTFLSHVSLNNADLRNANLLGARLRAGTNLEGVTWGNTICADGSNSDDNDGDNFTCESNSPANVAPTISLTSPAPGTTVTQGDPITISADAADSDGTVIRVEFYDGETLLNIDPSAPYSFDWTNAHGGSHDISAKAFDNEGAVATSQTVSVIVQPPANNQPPAVTITKPKNNATVYRFWGTDFNASASDPDGFVARVEFYAGSTLLNTDFFAPFNYYWRPASKGAFTLTVKAYDDSGAVTTSAPVTVRVR